MPMTAVCFTILAKLLFGPEPLRSTRRVFVNARMAQTSATLLRATPPMMNDTGPAMVATVESVRADFSSMRSN